jgi:hypothetical protein
MQKRIFLGWVAGMLTVASSAAAQYPYPPPPPPSPAYAYGYSRPAQTFGGPGTLAISSDMNLSFEGCSNCADPTQLALGPANNAAHTNGWVFTVAPAADYFVIQGLSIGGQIAYSHGHSSVTGVNGAPSTSSDANVFGIGARVGYNIPIGDLFSFWPKVGLVFLTASGSASDSTTAVNDTTSGNVLDLQIYAPLLLHLAPHFFVGLGPNLQTDLTASASVNSASVPNPPKETSYGLLFTIGGWTVPAG